MRDTSARYWSAICVMEIAPISTFWRLTRYSKRSNGPSKLSMRTLYDMEPPCYLPKENSRSNTLPAVASR